MKTKPSLALPGFVPPRWLRELLRFAQLTVVALFAVAATASAQPAGKKPNILVIWGDDVGQANLSASRTE